VFCFDDIDFFSGGVGDIAIGVDDVDIFPGGSINSYLERGGIY
jgi:hypothetical protein